MYPRVRERWDDRDQKGTYSLGCRRTYLLLKTLVAAWLLGFTARSFLHSTIHTAYVELVTNTSRIWRVPLNAPDEHLIATYNDLSSVKEVIHPHKADIVAIVVEPMLGSGGAIPASKSFLLGLRAITNETGIVTSIG